MMTWFISIFAVTAFCLAAGNQAQLRKLQQRLDELEQKFSPGDQPQPTGLDS